MKGRLLLFLFSSLLLSLFIVRFAIWGFLKKRKGLIYGIVIMMSYELMKQLDDYRTGTTTTEADG